jgi:hypothetical protein
LLEGFQRLFVKLPQREPLMFQATLEIMNAASRRVEDPLLFSLHHQPKACADPLGAGQLTSMLARDGALFTRYAVDGSPLERVESSSFYGAALPYLALHAPATRRALEAHQLSARVVRRLLTEPNRYFDANWVWWIGRRQRSDRKRRPST